MSMQGKVVLITGASRGIGKALAIGFAKEGARVIASARTVKSSTNKLNGSLNETVAEINANNGTGIAIACDVTNEKQVNSLIQRILITVGPIDVLINNAGLYYKAAFDQFTVAEFKETFAVNTLGPFLLCKFVLPDMIKRRQGNIINISSRSSTQPDTNSPAYGASKAALDRFTLNLALAVKPYNIAVNALGPGLCASHMTRNWNSDRSAGDERIPDPPEVVVPSAIWLAQQQAETFTGNVVQREDFGKCWP